MSRVLLSLFSILLLACGDGLMAGPEPDAGGPPNFPMIDAGVADAAPVDAAPPDAWHAPPDAPRGEVCDYMPGTFDEENMANYPVRFGKGQGLEISPDIRQVGLLELENAHIGHRDVVEKRRGAVQLGDSRSATPGDDISDADKWAIWMRNDETILQTTDSIYREQVAVGAFTWSRVGSWVQSRLREVYANAFTSAVSSADAAVLGDATLVAYQVIGGTAELAIYGPSMAREVLQTFATSERPRLTQEGDRLRLTYRDTAVNVLRSGVYTAGAASVVTTTNISAVTAGVAWDVNSDRLDTGNRVTVIASQNTAATSIAVNVIADSRTANHTITTGFTSLTDVAVSIWPLERSNRIRYAVSYSGVTGGAQTAEVMVFDLPVSAGAVVLTSTIRAVLTGTGTVAVATSWESVDKVWMAVEEAEATGPFVSYWRGDASVAVVFAVSGPVHRMTTLKSQGVVVAGTPTNTTPPSDLLSPAFVEQIVGATPLTRSGWVLFAPRTREIVARSMVGFTGDATTRAARPEKGSIVRIGQAVIWAGPAAIPSEPGTNLRAIAICKLDRTARANKPANLDDVSISAHAGYPRFYDGITPAEHDWHTLPQIRGFSAEIVGGGTITAGTHRFAVTWEAEDANGLRYRSAPMFDPGVVTSTGTVGDSARDMSIEPMSHTERVNVRAVVWMTTATLPAYYRATEAAVTGAIQAIRIDVQDQVLITREQLDQAAVPLGTGIQPSEPARVTDFVALLIDRLASRDPRVGSLLTFTTPSQEAQGYSAHWNSGNVVQEALDREITSALEVDGRVLMASRLGFSQLQGDGPDATGVGTFGLPLSLRAPIGIEDHTVTDRTPLGYAFGSELGPRLLTPGLTVESIDETVERQYSINGGHVVGVAFDQNREEIIWLDDSVQTLRLNTHNGRWASDSNRLGRDIAKRRDGTLYILRSDGKVLKQTQDVYADGAAGYSTTIAFRLRAPSRDGVAHGSFNFSGLEVFGEYLGSHAITARVYLDFRDGSVALQGEVPADRIVANAAAGRDYRYTFYAPGGYCYVALCEIELSSTTGQTARIDGIDVRYNVGTTGDSAQVDEQQRFSLDVVG